MFLFIVLKRQHNCYSTGLGILVYDFYQISKSCTRINHVMKNELPHCNLRIVFQTECKLINFFTFKQKIPVFLHSGIGFDFKCSSFKEHLRFSTLTGKRMKEDNNFAIIKYHLFCNHSSGFDNFSLLASNNNDFEVTLMENQQRPSSLMSYQRN